MTSSLESTTRAMRKRAGAWLQQLRSDTGKTQADLGALMGHNYTSTVSQIERGIGRVPPSAWIVWAEALRVDPSEFGRQMLYWYAPDAHHAIFGGTHPHAAEHLTVMNNPDAGSDVGEPPPSPSQTAILTFTGEERLQLTRLRSVIARRTNCRHVELTYCADDGDEWASIYLSDEAPEGQRILISLQLHKARGERAIALIGADGRLAPRTSPSTDVRLLLDQAERTAIVAFRRDAPYWPWATLVASIPGE